MTQLKDRLATLTPKQRALFEKKRKRPVVEEIKNVDDVVIPLRTGPGPWPASVDQTALWFIHKLNPDSSTYNIGNGWRMQGELNVPVLIEAMNEMIRRHEVLRTRFEEIDGLPHQVIEDQLQGDFSFEDLSHHADPEAAAREAGPAWLSTPFDLSKTPLFRLRLLRLRHNDHVLMTVFHHNITDWWSSHAYCKELYLIYNAFCDGLPSPLPPLPIQFVDYTLWRNQWYKGADYQKQLNYWLDLVKGAPTVLELPADRPRPAVQSGRGKRSVFAFTPEVTRLIRLINRRANVTTLVTILSVTYTWLSRVSGQNDMLLGTAISATRGGPQTKNLLGYLLNTLVFRADLSKDPSLLELIPYCRDMVYNGYANRDLPFTRLIDEINPERDLSRMPMYQIEFLHVGTEFIITEGTEMDRLKITSFGLDRISSPVDLQISFMERTDNLYMMFEYNVDIFEEATMQHLGNLLLTLAENMMQQPEVPGSRVPWLTPNQQQRLLAASRGPAATEQAALSAPDLIRMHAQKRPDHPALVYQDQTLTFGELMGQVSQLAGQLREQGVGPEAPVAVFMDRSPQMVVALLAVQDAGGVYTPLAPNQPDARLNYVLHDAGIQIILTQPHLAQRVAQSRRRILIPGETWPARTDVHVTPSRLDPRHPAYLIYTSGSTGKPKGSVNTHRNLALMLASWRQTLALDGGAVGLTLSPFGFDASVWEIFNVLTNGGTLHLLDNASIEDPQRLAGYIMDHGVTNAYLPPTLLEPVVDSLEKMNAPVPLRRIMVGVEPIREGLLQRYTDLCDQLLIINAYGPTEATVNCTTHVFQPGSDPNQRVPIGKPTTGYQVFLLDQHLALSPMGIPAELYIAGEALCRGYLNRPALTAERFLPHPFAQQPGERIYRSGDLARWDQDGVLTFVGRVDHQIKLRGYRIELGEIESALLAHDAVLEACVLLSRARTRPHLVAVLKTGGDQPSPAQLREFLSQTLPDYMVPAFYVFKQTMPLTSNGKLDRLALSKLVQNRDGCLHTSADSDYVAPRNPVEAKLCQIWEELLGRDADHPVGIHDPFFQIGGDSIISIQMVARAGKGGLKITPRQVYQNQTIAELAAVVQNAAVQGIRQAPLTGSVPLTPVQHWFLSCPEARRHFNLAFMLKAPHTLVPGTLRAALDAVVQRHDALRLCFSHVDGVWRQDYTPWNSAADVLISHDLSHLEETEALAEMHRLSDAVQASISIERPPLWRAVHFHLGFGDGDRLLLVLNHLIIDGVSSRFLKEDLYQAYQDLDAGRPLNLPAKTASLRDWSQHLEEQAQTARVEAQLQTWQAMLKSEGRLTLPLVDTRDYGLMGQAQLSSFELTPEETHALVREAPDAGVRINELLICALTCAVTTWSNSSGDLVLALEGHGREELGAQSPDTSATMGWLTAVFPVRLSSGAEPWPQALKTVREELAALPHKGLTYGLLRYLNPRTKPVLEALPHPLICFNYLGQMDAGGKNWPYTLDHHGNNEDTRRHCFFPINISCMVIEGRFNLHMVTSGTCFEAEAAAQLRDGIQAALRDLIQHCVTAQGAAS